MSIENNERYDLQRTIGALAQCPGTDGQCPTPITGWWTIDLAFQPSSAERAFRYGIILCQSAGLGSAYSSKAPGARVDALGTCPHALITDLSDHAERLAVTDSLLAKSSYSGARRSVLTGTVAQLATGRARLVTDVCLMAVYPNAAPRVALVGAVGEIVLDLRRRGATVRVTDLDEGITGHELGGAIVEPATNLEDCLEWADIAVVTGMTMANGTFSTVTSSCRRNGTRIMLYAESGPALADRLVEHGLIDAAVCEPFPFYVFGGRIEMFSRLRRQT